MGAADIVVLVFCILAGIAFAFSDYLIPYLSQPNRKA